MDPERSEMIRNGSDRSRTIRNRYEMDPVVWSYSIMINLSVFVIVIMIGNPSQMKIFQDRSGMAPDRSGMIRNGSDWSATVQNGWMDTKWILWYDHIQLWLIYQYSYLLLKGNPPQTKNFQDRVQDRSEIDPEWSGMVRNGPNRSTTVRNGYGMDSVI